MISKETATDIAMAHREIEIAVTSRRDGTGKQREAQNGNNS
jgi:hypothetical protein